MSDYSSGILSSSAQRFCHGFYLSSPLKFTSEHADTSGGMPWWRALRHQTSLGLKSTSDAKPPGKTWSLLLSMLCLFVRSLLSLFVRSFVCMFLCFCVSLFVCVFVFVYVCVSDP